MKKIFILPILIVPIMAHATDPVGPSAVPSGGTAVVATAPAPYQTAAPADGDSTTVVSASYVKGAYNDAIAAVNKVNEKKQNKLSNGLTGDYISGAVVSFGELIGASFDDGSYDTWYDNIDEKQDGIDNVLMSAGGVIMLVKTAVDEVQGINDSKRVRAVTAWGDDSTTSLIQFANAQ